MWVVGLGEGMEQQDQVENRDYSPKASFQEWQASDIGSLTTNHGYIYEKIVSRLCTPDGNRKTGFSSGSDRKQCHDELEQRRNGA